MISPKKVDRKPRYAQVMLRVGGTVERMPIEAARKVRLYERPAP